MGLPTNLALKTSYQPLSTSTCKAIDTQDVILVIDRSGSMQPITDDVIGGVNSLLDTLRADTSVKTLLTLVQFDSQLVINCNAQELTPSMNLDRSTYVPNSCTALYDAIGTVVENYKQQGTKTPMLVIYTDGQENASKHFTPERIKVLISSRQEEGWAVTFMGADQDAWSVGAQLGFSRSNTISVPKNEFVKTMAFVGEQNTKLRSGAVASYAMYSDEKGSIPETLYKEFDPSSTN